ncbi:hypothetical protein MRB53_038563 [Persea americana]|nr:hypothetical protein MRB53_038563 [Persea americana]
MQNLSQSLPRNIRLIPQQLPSTTVSLFILVSSCNDSCFCARKNVRIIDSHDPMVPAVMSSTNVTPVRVILLRCRAEIPWFKRSKCAISQSDAVKTSWFFHIFIITRSKQTSESRAWSLLDCEIVLIAA